MFLTQENNPEILEDPTFEVNYIENLTSEHEELENESELEDFNRNEIVDYVVDWASNPITSILILNLQTPPVSPFLPQS